MSNFQRTRSKVWWGDSPPSIGSPVAQQAEWNNNNRPNVDPDWEPQLPHWIANQPDPRNNNVDNIVQPNIVQINQWPLRHGSPGSHKSQDSGFSDSDSSPPPSQYYPSPQSDSNNTTNKSSDSDANNNENITVKQAIDFENTPPGKDVVDKANSADNNNYGIPTPKPRLRSSSVIQTPYDLQMYYEVHQDEEHMALLKDTPENQKTIHRGISVQETTNQKKNLTFTLSEIPIDIKNNNISSIDINDEESNLVKNVTKIEINVSPLISVNNKENTPSAIDEYAKDTSSINVNTALSPSKKYPTKKTFISSHDSDSTKVSKVAKVKDLETNKNISNESLEYIKLANNNEIVVNNQPRVRSPISNISYVPTERTTASRSEYRRSMSNEDNIPSNKPTFERNRLNKSLNFEAQRLDQQILSIQEGYHSLGNIDEETSPKTVQDDIEQVHQPCKAILGKNIMDSLNLKPTKKVGPKAKQRMPIKAAKAKDQSCTFRIFTTKKDKPEVVDTHAGGTVKGSRVPSLGLPRTSNQNQWVVVGFPEQERLIPNYTERSIEGDVTVQSKNEVKEERVRIPKHRRISPPPQFKDKQSKSQDIQTESKIDLNHNSKREKLRDEEMDFMDVHMNLACTSTPKMLAPYEYINGTTPKSTKKTPRRINLLDSLNGVVLNNQNEILYRERSIDTTTLERLCERKPEPVQYWLCDLVGACENECMTTLQSKPIGTEMKAMVSANSATITGNIKKVQTHGQIIIHQYSDVIRQFEDNTASEEQICLLVANINEFVLAHSITLNTKPPGESPERWDKIKKSLQTYLQKLIDLGEDVKVELNESNPEWKVVQKHLEGLISIFLETTKAVLVQQMKTLVSIIEEPPSDMIIKSTLTSIGHLAMLSEKTENSLHESCQKIMKSITDLPFVDCGVPRALLTAIIENNKSSVKALSLRALATVCVTGDAVKQFEEGGGIEIISDILSDPSNPEPQMREAITVLTQITAPWLRGHYDLTQLHLYLETIIANITGILHRTECCQLLLLSTACLVNLVRELELERKDEGSARKSDIVEVMASHHTVERLLDAVKRRGPNISVFLQEQTASLVAALSRAGGAGARLAGGARAGAVAAALVCFARAPPAPRAPPRRAAELRARARLQRHAAEAISRLSIIPDISHQIVQLEGVPHLIRLVKMQRTRTDHDVDPDQTLIYSLKALRIIYKNCPEAFKEYPTEVDTMIRPHLMESLVLFSAKRESYV